MIKRPWLNSTLEFTKLLRVDPYLFCVAFQIAIRSAPNGQLVQDNICMNWYNTSGQYCHDLPTTEEVGEDEGHFKTRILADSALFG